jgi:hypothetical protein
LELTILLAIRHSYIWALAAWPCLLLLLIVPCSIRILLEIMIGDSLVVRFRGLVGLVESGESCRSCFGLMGNVDFDAFAGEVFQGVVVLFSIYRLIENSIAVFGWVIDVDCFLI